MFEKIKMYYERGLWSKKRMRLVVGKAITAAEYEQMVGEPYDG